jgi:hypothetical protein
MIIIRGLECDGDGDTLEPGRLGAKNLLQIEIKDWKTTNTKTEVNPDWNPDISIWL